MEVLLLLDVGVGRGALGVGHTLFPLQRDLHDPDAFDEACLDILAHGIDLSSQEGAGPAAPLSSASYLHESLLTELRGGPALGPPAPSPRRDPPAAPSPPRTQ